VAPKCNDSSHVLDLEDMDALKNIDVAHIEEVVKQAGEYSLSVWPGNPANANRSLKSEQKPDGSYVTEADYGANDIIVNAIKSAYPDHGILSEELPVPANVEKFDSLWILDPIDGTHAYMDGKDEFSILLALCTAGSAKPCNSSTVEYGIMSFPARSEFVTAFRGQGAFMNGQRLKVSSYDTLRGTSVYTRHFDFSHNGFADRLVIEEKQLNSGIALLMLCNGHLDGIILKIKNHREWDLAAPAVVLEESGGLMTDEFGQPVEFNRGKMTCEYVVASNGKTHEQLLEMVSSAVETGV